MATTTKARRSPTPLLKMWLGAIYQAEVLKRGSLEDAWALVRQRLEADQDLRAEAEALRATLRPIVKARPHAHIEAAQLRYLDELLTKETNNGR